MSEFTVAVPDEAAMLALGRRLGAAARAASGLVVWLEGGLGAGKTTLTRGWLAGMGYAGRVKSPTYTLLEPYTLPGGAELAHLDLYRLADPEELEFLGLRELSDSEHWLLIEWPEKGMGHLPAPDAVLHIAFAPGGGREVKITTNTDAAAHAFALI
ncbi:MAG TPA: tRNA (adenosine(37)-N6)-threonylcarbamoyltransferase complex ATPase subunit type 1 TsaE [Gammaproteobacteria bacterium]